MAEAFGIVTGSAGLISLAIQITQNIKEAMDFFNRIKQAPNEVNLICRDLEVLHCVLKDIIYHINNKATYITIDTSTVELSLKQCATCTEEFKVLAEKLHTDILRRKKIAKIKVALKRADLSTFRSRLEDAKRTLIVAIQCYQIAVSESNHVIQLDAMHKLQANQLKMSFEQTHLDAISLTKLSPKRSCRKTSTRGIKEIIDGPIIFDTREVILERTYAKLKPISLLAYYYSSSGILGNVTISKLVKHKHKLENDTEDLSISFCLPLWILHRQFLARLRRSYTGWNFALRTYIIIPRSHSLDSIFRFCVEGYVDKIKDLFQSGLVTPFIRDDCGRSLIHWAVMWGRYDLTCLLLRYGVEPDARDHLLYSPLHIAAWSYDLYRRDESCEEYLALLRLLVDHGCDPNDINAHGETAFNNYRGTTAGLSWLRTRAINDGGISASADPLWISGFKKCSSRLVRASLPNSRVTFTSARELTKNEETILHFLVEAWYLDRRDCWESLIREAVRAGTDIHAQTFDGLTPFLGMFLHLNKLDDWSYAKFRNGSRSHVFRRYLGKYSHAWLTLLKDEGIDLKSYAEREMELWDPEIFRFLGITKIHIDPRGWVKIFWENDGYQWSPDRQDPAYHISWTSAIPNDPSFYLFDEHWPSQQSKDYIRLVEIPRI
ncbi:hypothetical protein F5884DRAFT_494753 [Xylogone sp. PMI_703]|nr:hypothetical protein F5884DRAFT_494753 [Xylogone sp. PMI_703]